MSIVLLSMTCKTLTRNSEWQSMSSLCVSGVKVNPGNAKIHFSIGNEHAQQVSCIPECARAGVRQAGGRVGGQACVCGCECAGMIGLYELSRCW